MKLFPWLVWSDKGCWTIETEDGSFEYQPFETLILKGTPEAPPVRSRISAYFPVEREITSLGRIITDVCFTWAARSYRLTRLEFSVQVLRYGEIQITWVGHLSAAARREEVLEMARTFRSDRGRQARGRLDFYLDGQCTSILRCHVDSFADLRLEGTAEGIEVAPMSSSDNLR